MQSTIFHVILSTSEENTISHTPFGHIATNIKWSDSVEIL